MEFDLSCCCSSDILQNDVSPDSKNVQIDDQPNASKPDEEKTDLTYEQKRLENLVFIKEKSLLACRTLAKRHVRNIRCHKKIILEINKVFTYGNKETSRREVLKTLTFLLTDDEIAECNIERFHTLLLTFMSVDVTEEFNLDELQHVIIIMEYLANRGTQNKIYRSCLIQIITKCAAPMLIEGSAHLDHYFKDLISLFDLIGYLLVAVEDRCCHDSLFNCVLRLLFLHNSYRKKTAVQSEHCIKAVENSVIIEIIVEMLAICSSATYSSYVELAAAFASLSSNIRNTMVSQNIIENIFCRFNPYFLYSHKVKPDIGLNDPNDKEVSLGDAEVHINTTLSLLVMILWGTQNTLKEKPYFKDLLKSIDEDALRSFEWAFRLECSRNDRKHERLTMAAVIVGFLHCYGSSVSFCIQFMKDLMILAVQTEISVTCSISWISKVKWNTSKVDLAFKRSLILSCLLYIRNFPYNNLLMDITNFTQGLIFLIDPNLAPLYGWSGTLFTDLKIFTNKVLVYLIKFNRISILKNYNIVQRTLCALESYNLRPLDVNTLYWNVRILQSLIDSRHTLERKVFEKEFQNHRGDITLINLCKTMLQNNEIDCKGRDIIMAHSLSILNSCFKLNDATESDLEEPNNLYILEMNLLRFVNTQIKLNNNINKRLLISLLNLIWDTVLRNKKLLELFICENGIHGILDLIDVECSSVQCIGLALLADLAYNEKVILQLYCWRGKCEVHILNLLARIFRDDCVESDIKLDIKTNIIQDLDYPLIGSKQRAAFEELATTDPVFTQNYSGLSSITVMDVAGSRISKVHALLCIMKRMKGVSDKHNTENNMTPADNVVLKLAEYYFQCKLGEVWKEIQILFEYLNMRFPPTEAKLLNDIYEVYRQWPKEIKFQQESILNKLEKKNIEEEQEFYKCLKSVNILKAWDALGDIKAEALTCDRNQREKWKQSQIMKKDKQLKCMERKIGCDIIRTFQAEKILLRDGNVTVQSMSMEDPRGQIKSSKPT